MARNTRRRLVTVGISGLALLLSACGMGGQTTPANNENGAPAETGPLSGEITFQTWSLKNENFTPYFEGLVSEFEDANPGTTVKWVDQPGDGYADKVMQQATAAQLPDVINLPPDFAFSLVEANMLLDLKQADPEALEAYTEGGVKAYEFEGMDGSFGYPWYLGTDLNWWNTQAFTDYGLDPEKLPTTLEELYADSRTMAENSDGRMFLMSSAPEIGEFYAAGVTLFEDGEFVFNTPEAADVLQEYVDLYAEGAMPPEVLQSTYLGNSQLFLQGKVAWSTGSASFPKDLAEQAPSIAEVTVPTTRIGTPPLFVQGISVAAESNNPALALAFAQFVTNNDNQVEFVKIAQGFLPGTKEGAENPESFTDSIEDPQMAEAAKLLAEQMPDAEVAAPVQFTDAMNTYMQQQITAAMRGDISAQEALDRAVQYCNDNLPT